MMNLQTRFAQQLKIGHLQRNPVITAAGTFSYGIEYAKIAEIQQLGAIICKGTTLHARSGNAQPRTVETSSGMLNAIGLQNPGVRTVIKRYASIWETWQVSVIVNIAGETTSEFAQLAETLEGVAGVAGIEVNVSCPNVLEGGAVFGASAEAVAGVTAAVRRATTLPLIVKLSPNSGDARPTALAAASAGADAISLINTITAISIDISSRRPVLANSTGGLSGPAVKPIALRMVYEVARELGTSYPQVPIIGIGGICNAGDALEFLMAGASAIQIGTINFVNPRAGVEIIEGIEEFMRKDGMEDVRELVGVAR